MMNVAKTVAKDEEFEKHLLAIRIKYEMEAQKFNV